MNKEFNAAGRQEREQYLQERIQNQYEEIQYLLDTVDELKKAIKYLHISIVVITCVTVYFMFALGS